MVDREVRGGLRLRTARPEEAGYLSELAMRSKAHWGYTADFMAACRDELSVSPTDVSDPLNDYQVAVLDGRVAGFCGLVPHIDNEYELDGLFVEPDSIGAGIGRRLLRRACELLAGRRIESLFIQSDPNADAFYESMGAVCVGRQLSASIPGRYLTTYRLAVGERAGVES